MGDMGKTNISIEGLSCAGCVGRAETAIASVEGAHDVSVNLATGQGTFSGASLGAVVSALSEAGYPARVTEAVFVLDGLSCASCVARVEAAVRALEGIESASVNFATQELNVRFYEGMLAAPDIVQAVSEAGYGASLLSDESVSPSERQAQEAQTLKRDMLVAGALVLPVFLLEMGGHLIPQFHHWVMRVIGQTESWMIQFVLTSLVMIGPGRRFYKAGVPALIRGAPDMNSLVAVGTLAAYSYSVVALFWPMALPEGARSVYFEAAGVIIVLVLAGRFMEARAKGQTGAAINKLVKLAPSRAEVQRGGDFVEIPLEDVHVGDVLRVKPGARIAVDGVVVSGESYVDEAMLTGEPAPVLKTADAKLIAGTVNGKGLIIMRAEQVGAQTVLAGIVRTVQDAQAAKLPIQALVDKITLWFVPAVMGLAVLTVLLWLVFGPGLSQALVAGVSVLIIACPCAMGLATPTSIMVGTGRAAELGVLFRKGEALQRLADVKIVAFDKTGTLTEGKPVLVDFITAEGFDGDRVLQLSAAAEQGSEHPVAQTILAAYKGDLPEVTEFNAVAGQGVSAKVEGKTIAIGTARMMRQSDIVLDAFAAVDTSAESGVSVSYVAIDGEAAALISVADATKDSAKGTVANLQDMGVEVAMITGDSKQAAQHVAEEIGITRVIAEVLPEGKLDAVRSLQKEGAAAFVGDGINDAPALSAADVGIAIGTGTDVAIESAEVVLMRGDPGKVGVALKLANEVMRNIRQNLFWAFAYNAALIPVAAGALYPSTGWLLSPMLAAGAMAFSSVFVVSNALRLHRAG